MAFREVSVVHVREVLRWWIHGLGYRRAGERAGVDRKTARRYVEAARACGVSRDGPWEQLTDEVIGKVVARVRPAGPSVRGESWRVCEEHREEIAAWLNERLRLTKVHELLKRRTGKGVAYRTLHRFATEDLEFGKGRVTVRLAEGKPGEELQVDFGRLGYFTEPETGRRRKVHALLMTAVYSRHQFVFPTLSQRLEDLIEGFEHAWSFFGGVFCVVIPDNMKAIVAKADSIAPRFTEAFLEYAQARGFGIDAARVRKPDDKARVERAVKYVRESFFEGESFESLDEMRERATKWCLDVAGQRLHGTTERRPHEVFEAEERGALGPEPTSAYDVPIHVDVKVCRDHHVTVNRALYSMPTAFIGERVHVRADRELVRIYHRGQLVKTHPRKAPGGRSTDPNDYPAHLAVYAMRDTATLMRRAHEAGGGVGRYAERLLETPLPWTRMRQVYRLLGLVRRFGAKPVEEACLRALEVDVVDVRRIERMVEGALERKPLDLAPCKATSQGPLRFLRPAGEVVSERLCAASGEVA